MCNVFNICELYLIYQLSTFETSHYNWLACLSLSLTCYKFEGGKSVMLQMDGKGYWDITFYSSCINCFTPSQSLHILLLVDLNFQLFLFWIEPDRTKHLLNIFLNSNTRKSKWISIFLRWIQEDLIQSKILPQKNLFNIE